SISKHAEILHRTAQARRLQAAALELACNPINGPVPELVDRLSTLRDDQRTTRLSLTAAAEVELARPHWIWDQRIPVGGVTLLAGQEGHGKTLLVCWLAARITQGQLTGERLHHPADVIYVGLEDDRSTVIRPRLTAAGADPARFHFVDLASETFALDTHLDELAAAASKLDVGLIV
ncbi:MAG: AAA family ATPase, partial [Actinomycetia bacterium]|nr:AAA family ATPase [Actinomycetes bacterium]